MIKGRPLTDGWSKPVVDDAKALFDMYAAHERAVGAMQ
jgi:hypothetical protein